MNARRKISGGIVLAAAALLAMSGCKKDEGGKVVLSAVFEQPAGGQKTYFNDHSVRWTAGDAVRINGTAGVAVSDGAVEAEASETGYAAVYPSENSTLDGSGKTCTGGTATDAASAPELEPLTDAGKSVALNFSEPLDLPANTEDRAFYLCVAPFGSTDLEIKVTGSQGGKKGSYVFNRSGKSLARSIMAEVKADFGDAAFEPFVPGFSVGAGTTVEFAPGNLWYNTSEGKFYFEENQWSFAYTWDANHVSHFKWSGAANAVTSDFIYSGDLFCASNFTVAGDIHTWRTLSKVEWDYLLGTATPCRDNASNLCAWKELDGGTHKGYVILPDGTENPTTVLNSITATTDLATYGAVFLPAAGYRIKTNVNGVNSGSGYYWSGTPNGDTQAGRMADRGPTGRVPRAGVPELQRRCAHRLYGHEKPSAAVQ